MTSVARAALQALSGQHVTPARMQELASLVASGRYPAVLDQSLVGLAAGQARARSVLEDLETD